MYLSLLEIDGGSHVARAWMANPYHIHQRLLMAFPDGGAGRMLFRVEDEWQPPRILVQAPVKADWARAFAELPVLSGSPRQKLVVLDLSPASSYRFRLRANPTKRLSAGTHEEKRDGPRVQLYTEEEQLAWLARKGQANGFQLLACEVRSQGTQVSAKAREAARMQHHAVTFEGRLEITDPVAFRTTLEAGIGSGKGFGFGLLSIARG